MHNTKKTKEAQSEQKETNYTKPGVYGLNENPVNGLEKALLVYPAGQEQFPEMYKHFNEFIDEGDILTAHIQITKVYCRLLGFEEEYDEDFFEGPDEKIAFLQIISFLSKIANEEAIQAKCDRIAKREAKKLGGKTAIN